MEFTGDRGTQEEKSWKFQGMGEYHEPRGTENPAKWRIKLEPEISIPLCGVWIFFWNHTLSVSKCFIV